jgi:hypothetical protein
MRPVTRNDQLILARRDVFQDEAPVVCRCRHARLRIVAITATQFDRCFGDRFVGSRFQNNALKRRR